MKYMVGGWLPGGHRYSVWPPDLDGVVMNGVSSAYWTE